MRTGSPKRKNESSVFSHLTESYGRDGLKRKDVDITKPSQVLNNLSAHKQQVKITENPYILEKQSYPSYDQ